MVGDGRLKSCAPPAAAVGDICELMCMAALAFDAELAVMRSGLLTKRSWLRSPDLVFCMIYI